MSATNIHDLQQKTTKEIQAMKPKDQVKTLLAQNKGLIEKALPKHLNPDRLLQVAQTAAISTPALLECYIPTLIAGIVQCSMMGLEPNTVLGHAYLVPFWNGSKRRKDVQVIVGYKGMIDLARRSGQINSIAAHAVFEKDFFEYQYGLDEKLIHVPSDDNDRGSITHFYAVAHMKDGGHAFEVMSRAKVEAIREGSEAYKYAKKNEKKTPWIDNFEEMGRKTAIRRLSKFLPLSVELATAVALDARAADGKDQNLEGVLDGDYTVLGDDDGTAETPQEQESGDGAETKPDAKEKPAANNKGGGKKSGGKTKEKPADQAGNGEYTME